MFFCGEIISISILLDWKKNKINKKNKPKLELCLSLHMVPISKGTFPYDVAHLSSHTPLSGHAPLSGHGFYLDLCYLISVSTRT